jgi:inner membrane protein
MMGKSHVLIGLGAGALLAATMDASTLHLGAAALVGGLGAMLPDIDHRHAPIRQKLGIVGDLLLFWLPHRGLTHSFLLWLVITGVGVLAAAPLQFPVLFALALSVGYGSHILADMMTQRGLPLLYPWGRTFYLLPKWFRVTTGSWSEWIAVGIIILGIAYVFGTMRPI